MNGGSPLRDGCGDTGRPWQFFLAVQLGNRLWNRPEAGSAEDNWSARWIRDGSLRRKTGTTAIQKFLIGNAGWLWEEFGLSVGFRGFAKATARFIVEPLLYTCNRGGGEQRDTVKEERLKDGLTYLYSQLNSSRLVVLSSEDFAFFDGKAWRCFMSLFGASTCMSAVVFHREAASWYAAVWAEQSKVRSKDSVNGRQKLWNKSPPFAAIDVVRLARDFHEIRQAMNKNTSLCTAWNDSKFNRSVVAAHPEKLLSSMNPAMIQAAKNIPVKCARLDALFHSENEKWFSRTGAEKPRSASRDICSADVAAFKPRHWQMIRKISLDC
ncbi:unnamed protein product [Symbiodinium sp. CCMP2456]|nr:unnamed protein product [Symbiodinium sp. CCMP2456]